MATVLLSFRPATSAEFDFARDTHHVAYRDVVLRQFGSWDDALQNHLFRKEWDHGPFEILLVADVPCGYAGVDDEPGVIRVRELVLLPAYQGRGLGTLFLQNLFDAATIKSASVCLQVLKANRARRLYGRLGFRETGVTKTHVLMEWQAENRK